MPAHPSRLISISACLCFILPVTLSAMGQPPPLSEEHLQRIGHWIDLPAQERPDDEALQLPAGMSRQQAEQSLAQLWEAYRGRVADEELGELPPKLGELVEQDGGRRINLAPRKLTIGAHEMPFVLVRREAAPAPEAGRPLFICTHGGGRNSRVDSPHAWSVNTREWQTQVRFAAGYYPSEGLYFVPRMADDRLGRWYHGLNQDAFERVAEHAIAHWGVDPNRVYLVGISEGGYGTAILAPFMPDRFGGANAMAAGVGLGNPAENLRNLAFRTDVGERDTTFNRVGLAKAFHQALDDHHQEQPADYQHAINVQPGRGHGINYRPGIRWVAQHQRNPWPTRLTWLSKKVDGQRRSRHYWVQVDGPIRDGRDFRLQAWVDPETRHIFVSIEQVEIKGDQGNPTHVRRGEVVKADPLTGVSLRVLLHDDLIDLEQPLRISVNGRLRFDGQVERDAAVQLRTLAGYGDPAMTASAQVVIDLAEVDPPKPIERALPDPR